MKPQHTKGLVMAMLLGALEAGGTKMVCSIGNEKSELFDRVSIPTTTPEETLPKLIAYFEEKHIDALGIASFGPIDPNPASPTYGYITKTPKPYWRDCAFLPTLRDALHVPAAIDTDVSAAALAEYRLGAGKAGHVRNLIYMTVGTGVGGGIVAEDQLIHGLVHPEVGHFMVRPHPADPNPDGFCPFHKSCLEGMAKGPTFDARWGMSAKELPKSHIGWEIEAYYLAQLSVMALTVLSTELIVLGGGVMQQSFLFPMIREKTLELLGGYISSDKVNEHIDTVIVPPGLGVNSGVTGALLLAADALEQA